MDKFKLVNIIIKDLEEIRILSEEVSHSETDSSLVIDLALNKARLLCQEIELLRDMTAKSYPVDQVTDEIPADHEEDEVENLNYPDPELEIINPEDREDEEEDEMPEEEDEEDEDQGLTLEEEKAAEVLEGAEEDEGMEEDQEEIEPEIVAENEPEEDWEEEEETVIEEEEKEQEQPAAQINHTELKNEPQPGVREIHIDDMDDDDIEPVRIAPTSVNTRPPMREIPKPEDAITESQEKKLLGEKFQKERSLNETLGEQKTMDSKFGNSPIPSLKAAIGLNDRFLFIREIFNNNAAKYNEVIERLDQMDQIQEAVEYLRANLSMQKNEASMKFVDLLKRRFTK